MDIINLNLNLKVYLENQSLFSDKQIKETEKFPIKSEDFIINGISRETILDTIKKFFILKGYDVTDSCLPGRFNVMQADKLIAFFVYTSCKLSDKSFITVNPWPQ